MTHPPEDLKKKKKKLFLKIMLRILNVISCCNCRLTSSFTTSRMLDGSRTASPTQSSTMSMLVSPRLSPNSERCEHSLTVMYGQFLCSRIGRIEKLHLRSTIYSTGCVCWIPSFSSVGSSLYFIVYPSKCHIIIILLRRWGGALLAQY